MSLICVVLGAFWPLLGRLNSLFVSDAETDLSDIFEDEFAIGTASLLINFFPKTVVANLYAPKLLTRKGKLP